MNRRILALFVTILFAGTAPVLADAAETGFLVGGSVGQSYFNVDATSTVPEFDEDDFAWKVFVGYRMMNFFQVEGGYRDLGSVRDSSGAAVIEGESAAFDAEALGILKLGPVDLFLKGGGAYWDTKYNSGAIQGDDDGFGLIYGGGVQFRLKKLGIRVEYEIIDVDVPDDLSMLSAGVSWTF